jgi:hypothetical protein
MSVATDALFQNLLVFLENGKYPLIDKVRELRANIEDAETKTPMVEKESLFVCTCVANICMVCAKDRDHAHELRPNKCKYKQLSSGNRYLAYIDTECKCYDVNKDFAGELAGKKVSVTFNPMD